MLVKLFIRQLAGVIPRYANNIVLKQKLRAEILPLFQSGMDAGT
jgi:hypothetical protein